MPTYLYEANANSSMSWLCCECGLPNISPSVFHTLSGISTSNSFSCLSDTTSSHDSSTDLGPPIATSSPNVDSGGNARNAGHSRQKRKLKAIVLNCDGLSNKLPNLETLIDQHSPDIIFGTESHLKSSIFTAEIKPPGFITFRKDRLHTTKGGVFIMVRDDLIATECNVIATDAELIWVEIHIQGHKPLIIGSFYRPPKSAPINIQQLSDSIADIKTKFKNAVILIAGDFNLGDIDWSNRSVCLFVCLFNMVGP